MPSYVVPSDYRHSYLILVFSWHTIQDYFFKIKYGVKKYIEKPTNSSPRNILCSTSKNNFITKATFVTLYWLLTWSVLKLTAHAGSFDTYITHSTNTVLRN